ncbi:MAG TPA: hypothetical protein VMT24_12270, partial [Aggregatilineaceae bacterium]|nr:hypothetical protein [Aggregatilineaceae bacterium]
EVLSNIRRALKPDGTLWVSEPVDAIRANALVAGALLFVLPTQLSYREKLGHLLHLRGRAVGGMQAAIESRGASPFEGVGRTEETLKVIRELFEITHYEEKAAFAGFLSAELKLPYRIGAGVMGVLWAMDRVCVRLRMLHGLNYTVYARHRPHETG